MKPLVLINFKSYKEASAEKGIKLAKICEKVSGKVSIVVAPQLVDTGLVAKAIKIPVFGQHVDIVNEGAYTGHVAINSLKVLGCGGTLINHSEKQVPFENIYAAVDLCKKAKLTSVVCAADLEVMGRIVRFCTPDYVAYEPPELIGGDVSVTSAEPDIVKKAVGLVKKRNNRVKVLCGAGVKTNEDVRIALKLGTVGVLIASGVVKAKNPEKALRELIKGL